MWRNLTEKCTGTLATRLRRNFKIDLHKKARSQLEELYLADVEQEAALEWKKHLLARKANEVATIPRESPSQAVVPVVSDKFEIPKTKYLQILKEREMEGLKSQMVNVVNIQGKQITFLAAPYQSISFKTLWKFMLDSRPDLIIAPIRPDTTLDNFSISKYTEETDGEKVTFKNKDYLKQLVRKGSLLLLTQAGKLCQEDIYERKYNKTSTYWGTTASQDRD